MSSSSSKQAESFESSLVSSKVISAEFYASTLPVPKRPFQYSPIPKADAIKWAHLNEQISDLLKAQSFDFQAVGILNVKIPDSTNLQPRLKIEVSSTKDSSRWEAIILFLCSEISKTDRSSQLGLDIESPNPNAIFPMEPSHPYVKTWSDVRDRVMSLLHEFDWKTIDVFLYGETEETAEPTIFITMEERQHDDWIALERKIRTVVGHQIKVQRWEG